MIPIVASVEQVAHQPLLLLLEECVATTTPDLELAVDLYTIIANKGYASFHCKRVSFSTL